MKPPRCELLSCAHLLHLSLFYIVFRQSEKCPGGCHWINNAAYSALPMLVTQTCDLSPPAFAPMSGAKHCANVQLSEFHVVPVFIVGANQQMRLMLSDRLLGGTSVLTGGGGMPSVPLDIRMVPKSPKHIQASFTYVNTVRPRIALWMFEYKDGDSWFGKNRSSLHFLADLFKMSSGTAGVRHGVFHWPPEFCDHKGATLQATQAAYEYVDFVFMFGYFDERLAALNKTKYLPFPLGPALSRSWQKPATVTSTLKRPLIAAYRGSSTTHMRMAEMQRIRESLNVFRERERLNIVIEERSWTRNDTLEERDRYVQFLSTARYALAPSGRNPNSYRIAEACESGSTPVIRLTWRSNCYSNWAAPYGYPVACATSYDWIPKAPFLVLFDWASLGQKLQERLSEKRDDSADLLSWYEDWLDAFRNKLYERVHAALQA